MSQAVLLGNPGTKRTVYLEKGARETGIGITLLDWKDFPFGYGGEGRDGIFGPERGRSENGGPEGMFLKIDPPLWNSCCLEELNDLTGDYRKKLEQLAEIGRRCPVTFLNRPEAIGALLDKRGCKRRLREAEIPVTEELDGWQEAGGRDEAAIQGQEAAGRELRDADTQKPGSWGRREGNVRKSAKPTDGFRPDISLAQRLVDTMEQRRVHQVFIKPVYGSGAAGVAAFRIRPGTGEMVLYTCCLEEPGTGRLVNTKRLRRFADRRQVLSVVDRLLRLDCVVERWYAKAEHEGFSYDLRAVVQDGQMDFVLARLSSGPVTNLHLNNHPLKGEELALPSGVMEAVEELCVRAAGCYPGLRSVGIDILLEKGSLRPRIIELNGQGDLIYQDIYGENRIYRRQAEMMREWLWKNTEQRAGNSN